MKPLINILRGVDVISVYGNNNIMIKGICVDSRLVEDDYLFEKRCIDEMIFSYSRLSTILKKDIILNLNDAKARGWSRTIKNLVKNYDNRFLLKLVNGADVDMLNIYNHHTDFINP